MFAQNTVIITLTILSTIALVVLAAYLLASCSTWFTRNRSKLIVIIVILGISVYSVGYLSAGSPGELSLTKCISSGLMAIFSMGRMFVLENDISELGSIAGNSAYQVFFGLIMTFSMLTIVMVVLSFFGYRLICKNKLWFIKIFGSRKDFYIFTELNSQGLMLAEDIKKNNKKRIIIFFTDEDFWGEEINDLQKKAKEEGYILTLSNKKTLSDFCIYRKALKNRIHFFANNQEENNNIATVKELSRCIKSVNYDLSRLTAYVFGKDIMFDTILDNYNFKGFELKFINELDMSCRYLFTNFTPISCLDRAGFKSGAINSEYNIALAGYSKITEYFLRELIYLIQFEGLKISITAMDNDMEDKLALFLNRNPELHKCTAINTLNIKPGSKEFFSYFNENFRSFSLICAASEDDKYSADMALELNRLYQQEDLPVKICLYIDDYEKFQFLSDNQIYENIVAFGDKKDVYKEDILINETLDVMAKSVHLFYCKHYNLARDWSELSLFEKQSNRALAMQIRSKLYAIGLDYRKLPEIDTSLFDEAINDNPDTDLNLAMGEHLRWNAFHFVNGWRTRQLSPANKTPSKDISKKLHACLVDWDTLKKVDKYYNKNYQETDMHLIRNIGNIVKSAGYSIIKLQNQIEKEEIV